MSQQKDLLREIAAATSSGAADRISDWFTEDFRLHEPGKPALPVGHEGPGEGDRVAVRWELTATYDAGKPYERSIMAIIVLQTDASLRIGASQSRHSGRRVPQNRG